jgi:ferredoxin
MRTTIFWFSGTGNSLKAARDVAAGLGDAKLVQIRKPFQKDYDLSADRIGIVFPVYMWGLPLAVKEFAEQLSAGPDKYIFAVTTYGGFPGGTIPMLAKILKKGKMKLSAGFGLLMPGNYTPMYGAIPDEKQQKMFKAADEKVKKIIDTVKSGASLKLESNNFFVNALFTGFIYKGGSRQIRGADKNYNVQDNCTKCGICAKVCPSANINLADGKPVWQHRCEQCMACLQWCPVEAIQYGKKTAGRKRYHHPSVKAADMFLK